MKTAILRGVLALAVIWALALGAGVYFLGDIDAKSLTVSPEEYRQTVISAIAGFGGLLTAIVIFVTVINIAKARRSQ